MSNIKIIVDQIEGVISDLQRVFADVEKRTVSDLHAFGWDVHARAVSGIQSGPASGNIYQSSVSKRMHQASAPGEYPMSDSGRLASSVFVDEMKNGVAVYTNVEHGRHLEFRPPRRGGRPWLSRAFNEELARRGW